MFTTEDVQLTRVLGEIETLSAFGRQASSGITRFTFSPEHQSATKYVADWMAEAGLAVTFDRWGNLYGRVQGFGDAKCVLTGSHVDSVPNGGNYDGPLGVLSSLEATRMILERGVKLSKPVEVVSFIEEEGARFMGGLLGSSLATGKYANADAIMGRDGTAFNDALAGVEFPYPVNAASNLRERVDSYLELHIEQGRRLESAGIPIGVVTAIAGPNFMRVEFKGRSDHAGATAYEDRHDTLLAAAETITRIREMGVTKFAGKGHMTVGKINAVKPNVTNVVAGETIFEVDFRADTVETAEAMKAALSALFDEVCAKHQINYSIPELHSVPAAPAPDRLREAVSNGARQAGVGSKDLVSWAAHDAMVMATVTDSGMIFVPCRDGRSHTPEEYTEPEDIAAGIATMANALVELAQ